MTGGELVAVVVGVAFVALLVAGVVRLWRKRAGEPLAGSSQPAELEEGAEEVAAGPQAAGAEGAEEEATGEPEALAEEDQGEPEPMAEEAKGTSEQGAAVPRKEQLPTQEPARPRPKIVPVPGEKEQPATTVEPLQVALPKEKPSLRVVPKETPQPLTTGLAKTRGGFIAKLGRLFAGTKKIDENLLEKIEEVLFTADIGVKTSEHLFQALRAQLSRSELKDPEAVWTFIREESVRLLDLPGSGAIDTSRARPFVILTIGVNGVGKTTTIGKLAALFGNEGKRVLLAAGDTFRAAAVEQLEVWGQRTGAPVVKGKQGGDPSSVVFDAIKRAEAEGYDVVIADTAGRLHTKVNLMQELQKVRRVCDKALPGSPHETILVLDATNGQNAISQAQTFKEAMDFTGIVLTKLDGTAKGGVILGICNELKIPVRYIGVGERVDDLRPFDAREFVAALYEGAEQGIEEATSGQHA